MLGGTGRLPERPSRLRQAKGLADRRDLASALLSHAARSGCLWAPFPYCCVFEQSEGGPVAIRDQDLEVERVGELLQRADQGEARSLRKCRRALNAMDDFVDSIGGFENKLNWTNEDRGIVLALAKHVKRACDL